MDSRFVEIGRVLRPRGNRGELRVLSDADSPEHFLEFIRNGVCFARSAGKEPRSLRIENAWIHKGFVVLKCEGIDSISEAEFLRNAEILVREEERPSLGENGFYLDQLIGLELRDQDGGEAIGDVVDAMNVAGNTLLQVRKPDGSCFLVPFVRGILSGIDLDGGFITATLPEGLEDLS